LNYVRSRNRHIYALQALKRSNVSEGRSVDFKLDALTSREWQLSLTSSELPTLKQFIAHRCQTLETNDKSSASSKNINARSQLQTRSRRQSCIAAVKVGCSFCKGEHLVFHCQNFLALPVSQRIAEIRKICVNCLQSGDHASNKCPSDNCKICKAKHNTLLHLTATTPSNSETSESQNRVAEIKGGTITTSSPVALVTSNVDSYNHVMLSTAVIFAYDNKGSLAAYY